MSKGWEERLLQGIGRNLDEREKALALQLIRRGIDVLGTEQNAFEYLFCRQVRPLGYRVPFQYARQGAAEAQEVFDLLGRIEFGVYT